MTLKKLRKKYKMWLTLAFVFLVLMFVLMGLQVDGWVEVCMGATFLCLVMVIYMMLRYGRCRVCYNLLDPYVLFHGGHCKFCGTPVEDGEEKRLIFRNMREMTEDEINGFFREGWKIGCAVDTEKEQQKLLEALSHSKETGFPQFVLAYEKDVLIGYLFLYGEEGRTWIVHNADEKTYEQEKEMLAYGRDLCRSLGSEKLAESFQKQLGEVKRMGKSHREAWEAWTAEKSGNKKEN
ncbi:hypothetical protein [Anaerotignum sp.]|uniref:hypothetical protein n=1 Tax=Anaerotignum sp. TaxID=2039241 RepID=UPI00373565CB